MNDSTNRGWCLRNERVNNRGRSNGRRAGQGQELSPHNTRNGNGCCRGLLVEGIPLWEELPNQVNKVPYVVE